MKTKEPKENMTNKKKKIEKTIIEVCIKIAKHNGGALIILGEAKYKPMVNQEDVKHFKIIENPKLLQSLATIDGAVIINKDGVMEAHGVKVDADKILKNFGTRHATAYSVSFNKSTTAFLVSKGDGKVKIFKKGNIVQIDAFERGVEKKIPEISKILEALGVGSIGVIGMGILTPIIGIAAIPGITIFVLVGGIYYLIKKADEWGEINIKTKEEKIK